MSLALAERRGGIRSTFLALANRYKTWIALTVLIAALSLFIPFFLTA